MNTSLSSYVRPARPSDADAIGRIQAHAMRCTLENLLNRPLTDETLQALSSSQFAHQWESTIRARTSGSAVYIAYDSCAEAHEESKAGSRNAIVGFAAGIASEGDGGAVFVVTAHGFADSLSHVEQTRKHGGRLLAALADYARKLDARALYVWLFSGDDAATALFSEAGFAPAGAAQRLDVDGTELIQHLWWAEL